MGKAKSYDYYGGIITVLFSASIMALMIFSDWTLWVRIPLFMVFFIFFIGGLGGILKYRDDKRKEKLESLLKEGI